MQSLVKRFLISGALACTALSLGGCATTGAAGNGTPSETPFQDKLERALNIADGAVVTIKATVDTSIASGLLVGAKAEEAQQYINILQTAVATAKEALRLKDDGTLTERIIFIEDNVIKLYRLIKEAL